MNHKTKLNLIFWILIFALLAAITSCSVGDNTPPAPIEDLSFDLSTRKLSWTATGDDENKGKATAYDLRFFQDTQVASFLGLSSDDFNKLHPTIDATIEGVVKNNFSSATQIVGEPRPNTAGTPESFVINRLDITGTNKFFFALDVRDEVGNNSGPSNVVEVTTPLVPVEFQSSAAGSCFGAAIGSGDFNGAHVSNSFNPTGGLGNPINSIVIGDPCLGRVYIFLGRNDLSGSFDASAADVTIIGSNNSNDSFGASVAGIGSIGGDSSDDLAIGAPGLNSGTGAVFIIFGSSKFKHGSPVTIDLTSGTNPDRLITGENAGDRFGAAIIGSSKIVLGTTTINLSNIEGGTSNDLIVGASGADSGKGRAYLFRSKDIKSNISASQARAIFLGESAGDMFGSVLSLTGDFDKDGFSDFAVGAPGAGKVYILFGQKNIVGKDLSTDKSNVVILNGSVADGFGSSISGGGDIDNGDGETRPDLLVGAPGFNSNTGSVFLYSGSDIASAKSSGISPAFKTQFTGNPGDKFGTSLSVLGDLNPTIGTQSTNEGNLLKLTATNADFAVGAPGTPNGTVYVFFGRDNLPASSGAGAADLLINGNSPGEEFGKIIESLGDITGDSITDFAVSGSGFVRAEF